MGQIPVTSSLWHGAKILALVARANGFSYRHQVAATPNTSNLLVAKVEKYRLKVGITFTCDFSKIST